MKKTNTSVHGIIAYISIVLAAAFGSAAMSIASPVFTAATVLFGIIGLAAILRGMSLEEKLAK